MTRNIYFSLLLFLVTVAIIALVLYNFASFVFQWDIKGNRFAERKAVYECGFAAFDDSRAAFAVQFYMVAILFLLFDLEIIFLLPFSVTLASTTSGGFMAVTAFLVTLTIGFAYEWRKGGLVW